MSEPSPRGNYFELPQSETPVVEEELSGENMQGVLDGDEPMTYSQALVAATHGIITMEEFDTYAPDPTPPFFTLVKDHLAYRTRTMRDNFGETAIFIGKSVAGRIPGSINNLMQEDTGTPKIE